jgi:hypothetical protein
MNDETALRRMYLEYLRAYAGVSLVEDDEAKLIARALGDYDRRGNVPPKARAAFATAYAHCDDGTAATPEEASDNVEPFVPMVPFLG